MVDRKKQAEEAKNRVLSGQYATNGGSQRSARSQALQRYYDNQARQGLTDQYTDARRDALQRSEQRTNDRFRNDRVESTLPSLTNPDTFLPQLTPPVGPVTPRVSQNWQDVQRGLPDPKPPLTLDQLDSLIVGSGRQGGKLGGINDFFNGFNANVRDSATLGLYPYLEKKAYDSPALAPIMGPRASYEAAQQEAQKQDGTWAGVAANLVGSAIPYAGAYKLAAPLIRSTISGLGPVASNLVRGTVAGGIYGTANELGEAGFGKNDQHWTERLQDVGINAALGGAGDAAFSALGRGLQKVIPGLRNNPAPTPDPLNPNALNGTRSKTTLADARRVPGRNGVSPTPEPAPISRPAAPSAASAYERALADGDIAAMRAVDPDTAAKMAAYEATGGSIRDLPSFLRPQILRRIGVSEAAPESVLQRAANSPVREAQPDDVVGAFQQFLRQNDNRPMSTARNTLETPANPVIPPLPQNAARNLNEIPSLSSVAGKNVPEPAVPPVPNAEARLGPDVDGGLGIVAGAGRRDPYFVPTNDTRSQIVSRNTKDVRSLTDTGTYRAAADRFYQNFIDDLSPIQRKIDRTIERVTGQKLDASESPYKMALAARGSDMTAKQIVTNGMVNSEGKVIGKSLKEVLAPIRSQSENVKFEDYLLNRHAITREGRGEKVFRDRLNWTPQKGADKIAAYEREYPHFKQAADDLYAFQKQLVDNWLVDSGMISREQADAWFSQNPFYVPNKRYFSDLEKTGNAFNGGGRGVAATSNPVKGYSQTGSQRKIISPIEAIIENVDAYVKVAQRNKTMQQLYKYVSTRPDDFSDFATVIRKEGENLPSDDLEALVENLGRDYDKGQQVFKYNTDNIVRVQVNGNTLRLKINDKPFLEALTAMGPQGSGWLLESIGGLTNFFKKNTTSNNPVFAFTRNTSRDFLQGYVASKTTSNPFVYITDYAKSISDILMNRDSYQLYKNIGGGHSSSVAADRNLLAQSKRQLVGKKGPLNGVKRVYDGYENLLNAVESAPRLAEFKRTVAKGGTAQQGLYEASDLTVNFKRKGRLARDIDKVFPYFNAAIQGFDQLVRLYANPATRGKAIAKAVVSIAIPAAAIYYLNKDDPNYQNLTDRQKDNFWNIPKGDGTFWKIALPLELGTIFSSVIQRGMAALDGEGNEAFRGFGEQLRKAFLPPGVSGAFKDTDIADRIFGDTIFAPFTQLAANKNFAGAPIVPGYLERLSPELQKDAKTSKLGEQFAALPIIGKIADNSPKKADFLLKSYLGWIGQFATAATTPGTGVGKALEQQVSVDPTFSNDIGTEFYDYKNKLDQAYTDREFNQLPTWYDNAMRQKFGDLQDRMSKLREKQRAVQSNSKLNNADKESQLRELQKQINAYAERGNEIARGRIPR